MKTRALVAAAVLAGGMLMPAAPALAQKYITIGTGGVTGRVLPGGRRHLPSGEQGPQGARHPLLGRVDRRFGVQHQHHQGRRARHGRRAVRRAVQCRKGLKQFKEPFPELRAVFSLHPEPVTVVARKESNINSFADLKGKKFNVGNPGSGTRASLDELIGAMGWNHQGLRASRPS